MWVTFKENREKHYFYLYDEIEELQSWVKVPGALFWDENPETCTSCKGSGGTLSAGGIHAPTVWLGCRQCYGTGWVAKDRDNPEREGSNDARQKDA